MKLSVIIPTRNRAGFLRECLNSLVKQSFGQDEFEVLVIDNNSIDNTKDVVNSYLDRITNLRYFFAPVPGLHVGRHQGMKEASSDILVFADDDIEAFPTWLESIYESFEDKSTVLVGGKILPKFLSEPPEWILRMWNRTENNGHILDYLSILDFGEETKEINPYYVYGCNFSIRKKVLLEAGGFHPDSMPQELIKYRGDGETHVCKYILEKKYKSVYNPKASVYHVISNNRLTVEYFCMRAYNQGVSDSFSEIRESHELSVSNKKKCRLNLKNILEIIRSLIISILKRENKIFDFKIQKKIKNSFYAGIRFHQTEVNKDSELLAYVLKKNYFMD